jgi:hypothetical protein
VSPGPDPASPRSDLRQAAAGAPVELAVTAGGGSARRRRLQRADGGFWRRTTGHGRGDAAVQRLVPPGGRSGTMVVWLGIQRGTAVVRRPPTLLREVRHRGGALLTSPATVAGGGCLAAAGP